MTQVSGCEGHPLGSTPADGRPRGLPTPSCWTAAAPGGGGARRRRSGGAPGPPLPTVAAAVAHKWREFEVGHHSGAGHTATWGRPWPPFKVAQR